MAGDPASMTAIYDDKTAARILAEAERMVEASKAKHDLAIRSERFAELLDGVHPRHFQGDLVTRAMSCYRELQQVFWRCVGSEANDIVRDRTITRRIRPVKFA